MTDRYPLMPKDYRGKIRSAAHLDFYSSYDMKDQLKHPKPHLLAINILADIVYWYRPREIRGEGSDSPAL